MHSNTCSWIVKSSHENNNLHLLSCGFWNAEARTQAWSVAIWPELTSLVASSALTLLPQLDRPGALKMLLCRALILSAHHQPNPESKWKFTKLFNVDGDFFSIAVVFKTLKGFTSGSRIYQCKVKCNCLQEVRCHSLMGRMNCDVLTASAHQSKWR